MIPFECPDLQRLLAEEHEIAQLVRQRSECGYSVPLAEIAETVGLDPDEYR